MLIEIENLSKSHGETRVLRDVSLSVAAGETLCITGPSGAGKSTLLRCINYLVPFDSGRITVSGTELRPLMESRSDRELVRRVRSSLGMVFQEFNLFPHLSALENVALGPREVLGLAAAEARDRAARYLDRVHLGDRLSATPGELSGGQRQRVAIARALAMEPVAVLMDEPTSALDPALKAEVAEVIEELRSGGLTMVVVTHEMELARRIATRVAEMKDGQIRAPFRTQAGFSPAGA